MNKCILIFLLLACSLSVYSQHGPPDQGSHGRDKIRAAHAAYITERLELTPEESERFWPVYRQYNEKRRDLRMQYRESRQSLNNEQQRLDLELKLKQQELDLEKDYFDRMEKIISAEKLVKLRQAEADFRKLIFRQIHQRRRR